MQTHTHTRKDTLNIQGNEYVVRSGIATTGVLRGEREVFEVNGEDPARLGVEEIELIYDRIGG